MIQHNRRRFSSLLVLRIEHTYVRDGRFIYQRSVPKDLVKLYGRKLIKIPLNTKDPRHALPLAERLDARFELEWSRLRSGSISAPSSVTGQAAALLLQYGIEPHTPSPDEILLGQLLGPFDAARERYAGGCEETYRSADPAEYLSPVQLAAIELLKPKLPTLEDALALYLETHTKGDDEGLRKSSTIAVSGFVAAIPGKPLLQIRRSDVNAFVKHETARGVKTGTIRRRLRALHAIFTAYALEEELPADTNNPFSIIKIRDEGEDAEEGKPLSDADWKKAAKLCREKNDPIRWLVALQLGTGTRIAEPAGIELSALRLDEPVPFVVYTRNDARRTKADKAATHGQPLKRHYREVPLVGAALWAAHRIKDSALPGQRYAFPQYIGKDGKLKGSSASATINKWMKAQGLDHTSHDFRHTLRDRLRAVECPEEIALEITGHSSKNTGTKVYGKGHPLSIRHKYLEAAAGSS